ncbi:MAG TPA: citramalate synthase [Verrucomicrobiae bacterium]|jgi:2-isopropylmalate synthase|nr:citramalate synthase [Verrucomicrobiae bacterium]
MAASKGKSFPKKILFYDTTLRDGTQSEGISLSLQDKLMIAKRLDEFGMHYIEGGWPGSNPKDLAFFKEVKNIGIRHAKIAAFGSTRRMHTRVQEDVNVKALLESKTKVVTIFGKSWDFHVTEVFKVSLKENLNMIYETVAYLKSKKLEVIYDAEHFFDGFKANPEYAIKALQAAVRGGADNLTLCDTNGGTLPHEVRRAILRVKRSFKTPLGIHCHNDGEHAAANSIQAAGEGAVLIQGTVNGLGERCGNANLMSIIPILQLKMKQNCFSPKKLKELTQVSYYVAEICNMPIPLNQPFTGRAAFAHKGGVHINAMMKNPGTYEHMDPRVIGNHRRFLVSELGGKTNIMMKAKELQLNLDKESPETRKILTEIQKRENEGYQYEAAEASFELMVQKILGKEKTFFAASDVYISAESIGDANPTVHANVTVKVKNKVKQGKALGDGPVDALYKALREGLIKFYPVIGEIRLTDYKVRVVNSEAGTAAKVRVFIEFQDKDRIWTTVGVDKNIIEASWIALVDAIQYKLLKG